MRPLLKWPHSFAFLANRAMLSGGNLLRLVRMDGMEEVLVEACARMRDRRRHGTAVMLLYEHDLFRDIIVGVTASKPGIACIQVTHDVETALRVIDGLNADKVVLIVETEAEVSLSRGSLGFLLQAVENDPRIRIVAITLAGSGISIGRWRWLRRIDSDRLMQEILSD